MQIRYENRAHQFLLAYRFMSYALAVMFMQVGPLPSVPLTDLQLYIILAALGAYTLSRAFSQLRWREGSMVTYLILIGDFLLSILLVIFTNGLNSYFLLYSLNPIMTAALFFDEKIAVALAAGASILLSISHLIISAMSGTFAWIMQGYNLTLLIVYTLFCFVAATVPYRINLNVRRRIESEAIIEERRRIAREMHDGVAQSLSYLNLKTKAIKDSVSAQDTEKALSSLNEIRRLVQNTYEDIRESIEQLNVEPRALSIIPALAKYVKKYASDTKIQVQFDVPKTFPKLSPVAELQLLRIVQEALTNIRRHASASEASVVLQNGNNMVKLMVRDNGHGFVFQGNDGDSPEGYHGLSIIKERAEGLGGNLDISTAPGKGTAITVSFPMEKVRL